MLIADFSADSFADIQNFPHPIQMSVLPVIAFRGDEIRPLGTCFAISNQGICLTARHVVDEALAIVGWEQNSEPQPTEGWWIGAVYVAKPEPHHDVPDLLGGILPAQKVHLNPSLDIAAISLGLPIDVQTNSPLRMPAMTLSPGLPSTRDMCFAVGYHSMGCNPILGGNATHKLAQTFSASKGEIKHIHVPQRDSFHLNFPCFETNLRLDVGMSGGPITNESGSVIGVVCSSFGEIEDNQHLSYGSLIAPALALQVDAIHPDGEERPTYIFDFATAGHVVCDETMGAINVTNIDNGISIELGAYVVNYLQKDSEI